MLTKCPECQKEVSSEADKCIHCGYPINKPQTDEAIVAVVTQDNSSKRGMGAFFIILGIIGLIGGIIAVNPSELERLTGRLADLTDEGARSSRAFENAGFGNYNSDSKRYDSQIARDDYSQIQSKRYITAACWFVPGGILLITGLAMRAGSSTQQPQPTKTT
jgi:hypothetical protein